MLSVGRTAAAPLAARWSVAAGTTAAALIPAAEAEATWQQRRMRRQQQAQQQQVRTHYKYPSAGNYVRRPSPSSDDRDYSRRAFTVGIGGPVGSGKTALVLSLTKMLRDLLPLGVVTNDIFTQEDAEFLVRNGALPSRRIEAVETGGCPHAAIREDVSANLAALERLTRSISSELSEEQGEGLRTGRKEPLLLCESGGDNLAANFSPELADYTVYVIDVAGGDKVPRKGGPGITQSDLLVVNKIDLAEAVGSDLGVMRRDAAIMRGSGGGVGVGGGGGSNYEEEDGAAESGPTVFASVRDGVGLDEIATRILESFGEATGAEVPEVEGLRRQSA